MLHKILSACLVLTTMLANSQTSVTALNIGTDSADFFLQKGLLEKQNGRRLESLKNFEKAARYDASSKVITAELASAYFDLRKYSQARESFKKLVQLGDQSAATYKQLMTLSFQLKQNEDVLLYADKLKTADPSEKVLYYVGKVHYDMDNYGDAIKYLNRAAEEDPANADIPYMIAHSYSDMMNYKLAIPYFKKAIELKPTESYWIYELGLICYAMNADKDALKYMLEAGEKGLKRDNDYLENLGIAYLNVGNLDEGVKILNEILIKRPSDMNILNMVAEAYYYKAKFDQAIEYWDRVLEYDKENASALYMIGMSYQKKGGKENTDKGIALCDKAIEMDPSLSSLKQKKMMAGM
ncbi:MAG: tetratricopeptide repeat protein [Chitinophagaceae bacterium]|jgi:tetratricopeptide (TPR) repeat protein|nr:tetratricopeptide repeat protein [Chitinophagaceae bacterium]MBK7679571.1 tetratricopeptide repeat protein [Chitinophagaceae bacterium]MBK8299081.1 tetratricopeptide repeat protein [Chitinophagaceae bacterium]MBK9464899.1 tetratricopeptide repeat protein [Chitinophagaceae bacterium]MBK9659738.1 tetratricopeptide repeat protein [Chitinophagaceae bacterium]